MSLTMEQIAKAKEANSVEELLEYAAEVGYELTEEEANKNFEQWHKEGELADEELDNVAGGSFCVNGKQYSDDEGNLLIVTAKNSCPGYKQMTELPIATTETETPTNGCWNCEYHMGSVPMYCTKRSATNDAYNEKIGGTFDVEE